MIGCDDTKAKRNAAILAVAQALYGSAVTVLVVTAGLVGTQLVADPAWATLPMSMMIVGTALTTLPISLMMKWTGRKAGSMLCSLIALAALGAGSLLAVSGWNAVTYTVFPMVALALAMTLWLLARPGRQ